MIGRTLDAMFSVAQEIGKKTGGGYSSLFSLAGVCRDIVLPLKVLGFNKDKNKNPVPYHDFSYWSGYFWRNGEVKRIIAKAFDKRRKIKIGETFTLKNQRCQGTGIGAIIPISYEIKRIRKNTIEVRDFWREKGNHNCESFVVSSSEKDLLRYADSGLTAVHYRGVIW